MMHKRALGAVLLLVVVIAATAVILIRQQRPAPPIPPDPESSSTRTLLVQVRDQALLARGSVVLGLDEERLNQLWWTTDWWVDQLGPQEVSAAELGRKPVPYILQTVGDQMQLRLDDAWVLDRLAFAGLVDAVGGVRIDVREQTVFLTDQKRPVVISEGVQTLSGALAADYVLDSALRDEQVRLTRFQAVWDQILRRFPTDAEKSRTLVVSLGALSKATMPSEELAVLLSEMRDLRVGGNRAQVQVVVNEDNAVRVRPPQGVRRAFALDAEATAGAVEDVFRGFAAPSNPVARVQATKIRDDNVEVLRAQLLARSWQSVWGGRTLTVATSAAADPRLTEPEIVGLEQALGVVPTLQPVPLAQAQVEVATDDGLATGL
jgi:hypothetical protein